jgi:hypothetical protein
MRTRERKRERDRYVRIRNGNDGDDLSSPGAVSSHTYTARGTFLYEGKGEALIQLDSAWFFFFLIMCSLVPILVRGSAKGIGIMKGKWEVEREGRERDDVLIIRRLEQGYGSITVSS